MLVTAPDMLLGLLLSKRLPRIHACRAAFMLQHPSPCRWKRMQDNVTSTVTHLDQARCQAQSYTRLAQGDAVMIACQQAIDALLMTEGVWLCKTRTNRAWADVAR